MVLLGIDIGTSACKAAAFAPDGTVRAEASRTYSVSYPQPGYAQQDPDAWYAAVCGCTKDVIDRLAGEEIAAVGIDGQSWSAIPVDKTGTVLHPTPIWFDTRAAAECEMLLQDIGFDAIFSVCGNPVKPGYTTPKVLWFKRTMPDVYARTRYFLQSNSYIGYRLTGEFSQDQSQGYGHFFYDMKTGQYNRPLAEAMGLCLDKFPALYACSAVIGTVTTQASMETGLKSGTPVVAGGLDAACGTLGAGVYKIGQTQEQGGQAGGMSICLDTPVSHPKLILGSHVVPGHWLLQGGTVGGGGAFKWFAEQFGASFGADGFKAIDAAAQTAAPGSDGVVFLPYMAGERSPIWDEHAKGVYYGLSFDKTRAHMARATMEGVAYALRHNLETAEEVGAAVDCLMAMGGSANSAVWTQIKADVTGKTIHVPHSDNATALGAAMLAGVGTGIYPDFASAVAQTVTVKKTYRPNDANRDAYDRQYKTYRALYEQLKELMAK